MTVEKLYGRRISARIGGVILQGYIKELNQGYDMEFEVEKTDQPEPNKGVLKIYNIDVAHRSLAQTKGTNVTIMAGYPTTYSTIFTGTIRYASHQHSGADWLTIIEANDGGKAHAEAKIKRQWKAGVPIATVIKDLMDTFEGIGPGNYAQTVLANLQAQTPGNYTLSGRTVDKLNGILLPYGYRFSIQDEQFQFMTADGHNLRPVTILSSSSGLIGTPSVGEKGDDGKTRAKMRSLLQPNLLPGSLINVTSDGVSATGTTGLFKATKVKHNGSNFGPDFYTDIEAEVV